MSVVLLPLEGKSSFFFLLSVIN